MLFYVSLHSFLWPKEVLYLQLHRIKSLELCIDREGLAR